MSDALFLVFTDLDGSLLDHHSYSYQDALPQLYALERAAIPVIPASSKTRVEIERLRDELGNTHPFIVENGAAVFIPEGYFPSQPDGTICRDGYWIREHVYEREHWVALLQALYGEFVEEFDYFQRAGPDGISRMTGLSQERARDANTREYSEPVQWLGTEARKAEFLARLRSVGAYPLQGGRFLSISGDSDKGRALVWLRGIYNDQYEQRSCHDLAIGDSRNDSAMLESAETALVIRSTVHDYPPLSRQEGVLHSRDYGPAGWAEGVALWLHRHSMQTG